MHASYNQKEYAAPILKLIYILLRTHLRVFTHISVHILPSRLTGKEAQGGCVGPSVWPATKNMSP